MMMTSLKSCVCARNARWVFALAALICSASTAFAQAPAEPATPPATEDKPADAAKDEPVFDDAAPLAYAIMSTSKGDVAIELDREKAPISVANFLKYAHDKYYDGTVFHRVIAGFMIQGGGYTADIQPKPGLEPAIKNEWQNGLKNMRGTLAMARLGGRPDSATSQFFINVTDNAFLDQPRDGAGYAVFAKVVAGMKVVDAIRFEPTGSRNGMGDVPIETVEIKSVRRVTKEEVDKMIDAERSAPVTTPAPVKPITPPVAPNKPASPGGV